MDKDLTIEDLYNEAKRDFSLTVVNIKDKSLEFPAIKTKWCFKIAQAERLLKKMKITYESMLQEVINISKTTKVSAIKTKIKTVTKDDIQNLKEAIDEQEDIVKFLRLILDSQIKNFGFDIKNAIETIKLESV